MRRRPLTIWVEDPRTATARVVNASFGPMETLSPLQRGIEPTITADGKLMVYQGHPANDGQIDILVYSVNATDAKGKDMNPIAERIALTAMKRG